MRLLKQFDEFVKEGIVKKTVPDVQRSHSLVFEAERKRIALHEYIKKIGIKNENANDYVEHCYDIILFLIRAKMFFAGYHATGQGAHEAEVSYARKLKFNENDVQFLDQLRFFRNGILYYGKQLDEEYAQKVITFLEEMYQKLK